MKYEVNAGLRETTNSARIRQVTTGIYLHVPFCKVRCAYCDFNTYAGLDGLQPDYVDALVAEIQAVAHSAEAAGLGGLEVSTVFFGGGTPSLLFPRQLASIFEALRRSFSLVEGCEISLEANPGTVALEELAALRAMGVNRLSFGVQSAQPSELKLLDRLHTFEQAVQAVAWARQAGFDNLNLDLIYGIMGQSLAEWQDTLHQVLDLTPEHLSLYALTLEVGTPMQARVAAGTLPVPDPDAAADMYEWARDELERHGYRHYEISNWARHDGEAPGTAPSRACRHNLLTWRLESYLGLGAGAHGAVAGLRYANVRHPAAYIERIRSGGAARFPLSAAAVDTWPIDLQAERRERMMLGLRLVEEGVDEAGYRARFGSSVADDFGPTLTGLADLGLVEWQAGRVRLTRRAHLLANQVFVHFV